MQSTIIQTVSHIHDAIGYYQPGEAQVVVTHTFNTGANDHEEIIHAEITYKFQGRQRLS